ncbi:MAG: type II toxin-antitoxin system PemK/MazF family toxin [Acidobacteria bacterium]|nr:type II toxin-antitoxin system PemK/MazF family toxin [Acidobacteriota bacterium]
MKRGEVWWVSFDAALDGEIKKTRPAVVVSNNAANAALNRVVVVPLTSRVEKVYPGEVLIMAGGRKAKAMADQIMGASKQRLQKRLDTLSPGDLRAIEDAVLLHLGIRR